MKLAINGGKPIFKEPIKYSQHVITDEDETAVIDALRSDWIAGRSDTVRQFEQAVCEFTGYKHAIAVNSATSGLYIVCLFYSTDGFQTITVPSLTFVATMNAPLLSNRLSHVQVVDVNPETFTMDDSGYESIPVSYAGYPLDNDSFLYDNAHCFSTGMRWGEKSLVSVVSTHAIKPITTGEGGVILTDSSAFAEELRALSDHGHNHNLYGHNFRMSSIQAALGLSQLKRADDNFMRRREIAKIYRDRLPSHRNVKLQKDHSQHSNHIFPLILDESIDRDWIRKALEAEGVTTQIHYKPLHLIAKDHSQRNRIHTIGDYPVSEAMWYHGFSLPIHNGMTFWEARLVMDAFEKVMEYYLINLY